MQSGPEPFICGAASAALIVGGVVATKYIKRSSQRVAAAKSALLVRGVSDTAARRVYRVACRQLGLRSGIAFVSGLTLLSVALHAAWQWKKNKQPVTVESVSEDINKVPLLVSTEALLEHQVPPTLEAQPVRSDSRASASVEPTVVSQKDTSSKGSVDVKACAYMYALCYAGAAEELKTMVNLKEVLCKAEEVGLPCPLDAAVQNNLLDVAETLLKAGVNTERFNYRSGNTPLLSAVVSGSPAMVQLLLKYGASLSALNIDTQLNALQFAQVFYGDIYCHREKGDLAAYEKIISVLKSAAHIADSSCVDHQCVVCHELNFPLFDK